MSRALFDVLVVGAGVVGATLALGLARDGRRVGVVEAHRPPGWDPQTPGLRVVALAPDAVEQFRQLGVWEHLPSSGAHPYRRMRVWDAAGGEALVFDGDRLGQPQLGWIVDQSLLADRLWAALEASQGVETICPARVESLEQDADSVRLGLDDGRRLRARLVVAADGAGSLVRGLAGIEVSRHDYRQRGLVAYVETGLPHQDTAWQRFLPGGPLAFLPCADGRSSIVWSLPDAEAARLLEIDEQGFRAELTRAFDATLGEVGAVSRRVAFPLRRQLAKSYVAGRVVLAGDAAHAVHPLAGQGVNLGLRDVACLRGLIAAAGRRDVGADHRLARYQRQRRSDNVLSALAFEGINHLFSTGRVLPTLLRGPMLGQVGRLPPLVRALWGHAAGR